MRSRYLIQYKRVQYLYWILRVLGKRRQTRSSTKARITKKQKLDSALQLQSTQEIEPIHINIEQMRRYSPSKQTYSTSISSNPIFQTEDSKKKREQRFAKEASNNSDATTLPQELAELTIWSPFGHLKGTCTNLEKPYLRLTEAPKPSQVRPLSILKQSFQMVTKKWREEEDYNYVSEQFKSIRQDLVVQGIRNNFTLKVYCTHARIAIQVGDTNELSQCQSVISELHRDGFTKHRAEFTAYKILHFVHLGNHLGLACLLTELESDFRNKSEVSHALRVYSAHTDSNYHKFFILYQNSPHKSRYLMDKMIPQVRENAIRAMIRTYNPCIPIQFVQKELGFSTDKECVAFLREHHLEVDESKSVVLTRQSKK